MNLRNMQERLTAEKTAWKHYERLVSAVDSLGEFPTCEAFAEVVEELVRLANAVGVDLTTCLYNVMVRRRMKAPKTKRR